MSLLFSSVSESDTEAGAQEEADSAEGEECDANADTYTEGIVAGGTVKKKLWREEIESDHQRENVIIKADTGNHITITACPNIDCVFNLDMCQICRCSPLWTLSTRQSPRELTVLSRARETEKATAVASLLSEK